MRVMIVTDAWFPQTNGVVRTLGSDRSVAGPIRPRGAHADAAGFPQRSLPHLSRDPAVALSRPARRRAISAFAPQACTSRRRVPWDRRPALLRAARDALHDLLPHPVSAVPAGALPDPARRFPIVPCAGSTAPARAAWCRPRTRAPRSGVARIQEHRDLAARRRHARSSSPRPRIFSICPRPVAAYVGTRGGREEHRGVSPDALERQQDRDRRRPRACTPRSAISRREFAGYRFAEDLARYLAAADVMVFPSRTDTFGLVNLEAMACGVPVAAYPVTGPIDVVDRRPHGSARRGSASRGAARAHARSGRLPAARAALRVGCEHARVRG